MTASVYEALHRRGRVSGEARQHGCDQKFYVFRGHHQPQSQVYKRKRRGPCGRGSDQWAANGVVVTSLQVRVRHGTHVKAAKGRLDPSTYRLSLVCG